MIELYTDGSCLGNPGPGGWAALLRYQGTEKLLSGAESDTTNNRMELMAAIAGLEQIKVASQVRLTTDSEYVRQGITAWIPRWRANGWRTANRKPVKNQDLWRRLDAVVAQHEVQWRWVKGHSGDPDNERVDAAARAAIDGLALGRS